MIRFALTCDADHPFDSWFQSSLAYDTLVSNGQVTCPVCGSAKITKALMAPAVQHGDAASAAKTPPHSDRPLDVAATELQQALANLRREVEENSEYVGMNFASEARAIHLGDAPARSIYGEARHDEARKLHEDGVPVAPLPFVPKRRAN